MLKLKWGWGQENTHETATSLKILSAFPMLSIFLLFRTNDRIIKETTMINVPF